MSFDEFKQSLKQETPPSGISEYLQVLWYDGCGDWDRAHAIAQDIPDSNGSLLHAYLHRKEGDLWNAEYWYRRAGQMVFRGSLDEEWEALANQFTG